MKKLLIILVLMVLFCSPALAETHIYAGGKLIPKGGDTEGLGGGTVLNWIEKITPSIFICTAYTEFKTNEGEQVNDVIGQVGYLSDVMIPQVRAHYFVKVGAGVAKEKGEKLDVAKLVTMGFCFDLSKETSLWTGTGYSDNGGLNLWSFEFGISWNINWK